MENTIMFNLADYKYEGTTFNDLATTIVKHEDESKRTNPLIKLATKLFSNPLQATKALANRAATHLETTDPNIFRDLCSKIDTRILQITELPEIHRTDQDKAELRKLQVLKSLPAIETMITKIQRQSEEERERQITAHARAAAHAQRTATTASNSRASTSSAQTSASSSGSRLQASTSSAPLPRDIKDLTTQQQAVAIVEHLKKFDSPAEQLFILGKIFYHQLDEHTQTHGPRNELLESILERLNPRDRPVSQPLSKELLRLTHKWEQALQFVYRNYTAYIEQGNDQSTIAELIVDYIKQEFAIKPGLSRIGTQSKFIDQLFDVLHNRLGSEQQNLSQLNTIKAEVKNSIRQQAALAELPPNLFKGESEAIEQLRKDEYTINNDEATRFFSPSQERRYQVRDETKEKIDRTFSNCGVQNKEQFTEEDIEEIASRLNLSLVRFFTADGKAPTDGSLIGRGVVSYPITMDYTADWTYKTNSNHFLLTSAAALNIGERDHAEDFQAYSKSNGHELDEEKYLDEMERTFETMLTAQEARGIDHTVLFPFGMGAFLRDLKQNDPKYNNPEQLKSLRYKIAERLVQKLQQYSNMNVHLCLPVDFSAEQKNKDLFLNYEAFITALYNREETGFDNLQDRLTIHLNSDATAVAQKLANELSDDPTSLKVGLWNASNKNMIGHFWYSDGAQYAIEENLFRRSFSAGLVAAFLNGGVPIQQGRDRNYIPTSTTDNIATRIKVAFENRRQ